MNFFPEHIALNGKQVLVNTLLKSNFSTEWENEALDFLNEWYAPGNTIRVNTSGSTGVPKTISLDKTFIAASAQRTLNYFNLNEGDKVLHCLPSRYIAGKLMFVRALLGKLDLHLIDPASNFTILEKEDFKFAAMVSNQLIKIVNSKLNIDKLEHLLIGGAAISSGLEKELQSFSIQCYSSYGMTETATHIALRKINGKNTDSFYHCLNGIRVQLSDKRCLQIFMPGREKPFQTTDLAEIKNETSFQILGRSDNVIISGGIKYSPEVIEKKLGAHIHRAFMISSRPHQGLGQQIILLAEGVESTDSKKEIQNICQIQLSKFEHPRQIIFIDQLPRTENGKWKRK
jgi:O-succinylbenzoic acid--CoA ligase